MTDANLLAAIIQGEGGGLGPPGMSAVAWVLARHIRILKYNAETLKQKWCGWNNAAAQHPGATAWELAFSLARDEMSVGDYEFCMSQQDVNVNGWQDGDMVIRQGPDLALHLYVKWPQVKTP